MTYYSRETVHDAVINQLFQCSTVDQVEEIIAKLPAADVRPVVMCRDCGCWNDWDSAGRESLGNYVCSCAYWSVEDGPVLYTRPTDFCSYGERREER